MIIYYTHYYLLIKGKETKLSKIFRIQFSTFEILLTCYLKILYLFKKRKRKNIILNFWEFRISKLDKIFEFLKYKNQVDQIFDPFLSIHFTLLFSTSNLKTIFIPPIIIYLKREKKKIIF